jgi:cytochrome b561
LVVSIAFILGPDDFGQLMHRGINPASRSNIVWHESLGIAILVLTVKRLFWLALRPSAPQIPARVKVVVASFMQPTAE